MPKFSIVIPTRSRAHLLRHALKSAMNQTKEDYEIIVSDNDSSDNTAEVVQELGNERVRYFRTPKTLALPDNFEFGLSKASGDWVTILPDDAAVSSRLLEMVEKAMESHDVKVITWSHFSRYYHDTWQMDERRNLLIFVPFSKKFITFDSKAMLSKWFNMLPDHTLPVMLNTFCHRSLFEEIQRETGRFFFPLFPDISSSVAMTASTEKYLYLDLPLGINGVGKESIGMSQSLEGIKGKAASDVINEFETQRIFQCVPLQIHTVANYIAESVLRVKEALPHKLGKMKMNWPRYFYACYRTLLLTELHGGDVRQDKEVLFSQIQKLPLSLKTSVYYHMLITKLHDDFSPRTSLRKIINRHPFLTALESRLRQRPTYGETVAGQEAGFSNIFEASRYLDGRVF